MEITKEWAASRLRFKERGAVSQYTLSLDGLKVFDFCNGKNTVLNWLSTILKYRVHDDMSTTMQKRREYLIDTFGVDIEGYDVVRGYRLDDSYFDFAGDFLNGAMNLETLDKVMYLGDLGEQYAIKTQFAMDKMRFQKKINAPAKPYKKNARNRVSKACSEQERLLDVQGNNGLFILDIVREEMKNNDPRLSEFVCRRSAKKVGILH